MPRRSHVSKKSRTTTHEDERKLVVLEFLLGDRVGGTAHYIRDHASKLRSQDGSQFQVMLNTMVERNWLERTETDLGGGNSQVTYKISAEGVKVIETIKELKNENNPLAKLSIFDQLD